MLFNFNFVGCMQMLPGRVSCAITEFAEAWSTSLRVTTIEPKASPIKTSVLKAASMGGSVLVGVRPPLGSEV